MNYEIELSSLESKAREFETLQTSMNTFVNDLNHALGSLSQDGNTNIYSDLSNPPLTDSCYSVKNSDDYKYIYGKITESKGI